MIWDEGCTTIAMITRLEEGGKIKAHQYWPSRDEILEYGNVLLRLISEEEDPVSGGDFVHRQISVTHLPTQSERVVHQFQMLSWPDHGLPESPQSLIRYLAAVREHQIREESPAPVVLHCGAGIGRTGLYLLVDINLQAMMDLGRVDVAQTLLELRKQRLGSVQTMQQYEFAYLCLHALYLASNRANRRNTVVAPVYVPPAPEKAQPVARSSPIASPAPRQQLTCRRPPAYSPSIDSQFEANRRTPSPIPHMRPSQWVIEPLAPSPSPSPSPPASPPPLRAVTPQPQGKRYKKIRKSKERKLADAKRIKVPKAFLVTAKEVQQGRFSQVERPPSDSEYEYVTDEDPLDE